MKPISQLFIDILTNTATEEQQSLFQEQMQEPESKILFEKTKRVWEESSQLQGYHQTNSQKSFRELSKKIEQRKQQKKRLLFSAGIGAAASIILLLGLFSWFSWNSSWLNNSVVIQTEVGNRTIVYLPDSTKVWLNSLSSLSYSKDFGKGERRVKLDGEGYFEVAHNNVPFVLDMRKFDIRVHGTKFNVSAYSDEPRMYITLEEGLIGIKQKGKKEFHVKPNQLATYSKDYNEFTLSMANVKEYSIWKKNKMFMHAEPLAILARKLERKFNVKIEFEPSGISDSIHYSGVFDVESIEEILDAISLASGLKYKRQGTKYTIYMN